MRTRIPNGASPQPDEACARRLGAQVDSTGEVPAGKDNLYAGLYEPTPVATASSALSSYYEGAPAEYLCLVGRPASQVSANKLIGHARMDSIGRRAHKMTAMIAGHL